MALLEKKPTETKKIYVQTTQCVYNCFWQSLFTQCLFGFPKKLEAKKIRTNNEDIKFKRRNGQ